jgi:hypothetical protein
MFILAREGILPPSLKKVRSEAWKSSQKGIRFRCGTVTPDDFAPAYSSFRAHAVINAASRFERAVISTRENSWGPLHAASTPVQK